MMRARKDKTMGLWRRLMRWLRGYEVATCPHCSGELLRRDGPDVHMGWPCEGWLKTLRS